MRTFEFIDDSSKKFWNIDLEGTKYTVTFGKLGTTGQTQIKEFPTAEKARKAYEKVVNEKIAKGYVETTPRAAAVISPEREALEKALAANPDDIATHSAYADFLMEQNPPDPRGEFIQVQLALEDESRSREERETLRNREAELLALHSSTWLGAAGPLLVGKWSGPDKPYFYRFVRGWLDSVKVLPSPPGVVSAIAAAPESRLLRQLEIVYDMDYHPFDFDKFTEGPRKVLGLEEDDFDDYDNETGAEIFQALLDSPHLTNLRVARIGFSDHGERISYSTMVQPFGEASTAQVIQLLERNPRLEELYLNIEVEAEKLFASPQLGQLRVFQYYFGSEYVYPPRPGGRYPLEVLANNPSLSKLTTLRFHAGRDTTIDADQVDALVRSPNLPSLTHLQIHLTSYGDEGVRRIIASGVLQRLKWLDIGYGNMTDEGAALLAACPEVKNLEYLNVSRNGLTRQGIAALKASGVKQLVADDQHNPDDQDYLYEVDQE